MVSLAIATAAIAVLQISVAISLAALIFAGPLDAALPTAAGAAILSASLAAIIVGWRSSFEGTFAGAQDTAGVVVATVVGPATVALSGETRPITALVIVATSTLVVAITFSLLGTFRLGSLVRYIPQPVVGGFIAGTGWLMLRGGVEVMVNRPIPLTTVGDALRWGELQLILPGLFLAGFIVVAVARNFTPISISLAIVLAACVFYVGVALFSSVDAVQGQGWLIGPFESSAQWRPITLADLADVDWGVVLAQIPAFGAIALISVVGLLLNLTALEAVVGEDIEFDRELKLAGVSNLLAGLGGGLASWHRIGDTLLGHHLQVKTRIAPIAVGVIGVAVILGGSGFIELIPRAVAGGVLAGLGLALLYGWIGDYWVPSERTDRALGLGILIAIAAVGPLIGVAIGVVVAVGLFVVQYSRIDPVRHSLPGGVISSNVDRAAHAQAVIDDATDSTRIMILDGYLFFGSATRVVNSIRHATEEGQGSELTSLIFDMERVIGVDVSAATALTAAINRLAESGISVIICGANSSVERSLTSRDLHAGVRWSETLDEGVEISEDRLLEQHDPDCGHGPVEVLGGELGDRIEEFLSYCTKVELQAGGVLIHAGEAADSLYFIETGQLLVTTTTNNGTRRRLRKTGAGAVLGEVAFAAGGTRTADVIAESAVVAHELKRSDLEILQAAAPDLAAEFQTVFNRHVATRLRSKIEAIDELLR